MGEKIQKLKKFEKKLESKIEDKILLFRVFDEPRPKYVAKITVIDRFIDKVFLWAFPQSVNPNHITVFRFITIPFILYFLLAGYYKIGFVLFTISAISDAIDGAIARTRNKITDWGILFDPFADKLLIGSVGGIIIYQFLSPTIAFSIIFLELILLASSYYRFKGKIVPAKTAGKVKMILQCVGVCFIFLSIVTGSSIAMFIATYILYGAIFSALMSLFVYRSI
jgi:CDP-diacylglycerol--glycerol-3-phosphate 3-phosphatidyltransferase